MDPVPAPQPGQPPRLVAGRYQVGELLGRGAMGEVRAGFDQRLGRPVAVKFLRADMAGQPSIRERFEEEARSAARLVHPYVVAVFDTGEEDGVPWLVMERLSGRTLVDEIAAGPVPLETVQAMGVQMLEALAGAHAAGLVHRDVKPGNILAAGPGLWKIGDFGIAKSLQVGDSDLTMTGMILGTPAYLAPERLAGGAATVASDLYAAGIVLYEALAGHRPFPPDTSPVALVSAVPPPVTQFRPDAPAPLARVVMRALSRDPGERFASAQEMADALREALPPADQAQTVALPAPSLDPTATQVLESEPLPAPVSLPRPGPRTPRRLGWSVPAERRRALGAGLPVLLGAVVVALILTHHAPPATVAGTVTPGPSSAPVVSASLPAPLESALSNLEHQVQP